MLEDCPQSWHGSGWSVSPQPPPQPAAPPPPPRVGVAVVWRCPPPPQPRGLHLPTTRGDQGHHGGGQSAFAARTATMHSPACSRPRRPARRRPPTADHASTACAAAVNRAILPGGQSTFAAWTAIRSPPPPPPPPRVWRPPPPPSAGPQGPAAFQRGGKALDSRTRKPAFLAGLPPHGRPFRAVAPPQPCAPPPLALRAAAAAAAAACIYAQPEVIRAIKSEGSPCSLHGLR